MTRYALHPACRVRKERFGLLFYDRRGPRLLFAETEDLLEPEALRAGFTVEAKLGHLSERDRARVARLLSSLAAKGFVREQPVC